MTTPTPDGLHREVRERLGAYVLRALDDAERAEVDAHLGGCARCRAEVEDLLPLVGPLAAVDPDAVDAPGEHPPADADGFAAVLDRIRAEGAAPPGDTAPGDTARENLGPRDPESAGTVHPLRRRPRTSTLRLAAAAAVIALAGVGIGTLVAPGAPDGPLESVGVQALRPGIDAEAGVVPHTWGVEVKLIASGFDPGRTYRAAVLDVTGRPIGAGEFVGTGAEEMECNLNSSVLRDRATGFVVTDAAGDPVLVSRFSA